MLTTFTSFTHITIVCAQVGTGEVCAEAEQQTQLQKNVHTHFCYQGNLWTQQDLSTRNTINNKLIK